LNITAFDPNYLSFSTPDRTDGLNVPQFEYVHNVVLGDFNPVKLDMSWSPMPVYSTALTGFYPTEKFLSPSFLANEPSGIVHSNNESNRELYSLSEPNPSPENQPLGHSAQGGCPFNNLFTTYLTRI
jgi:hypothetical protein